MRGKCKSGAHQQSKKSDEEKEREVAVLAFDYMFPKSEQSKSLGIESLPILIGINRKLKWKSANMVPEKGANPYAAAVMSREIELAGYNRLVIKSDQEPAILSLIQMAKAEDRKSVV